MDSSCIFDLFRPADWQVFGGLLVLSVGYAVALEEWGRRWPESFSDNTWVSVVIGVAYVLLGLGLLLEMVDWLRVAGAFLFASLPIIGRSLVNQARRRRAANRFGEE